MLGISKTEETFPEYGLQVHTLSWKGDDTGRRFVTQNGEYVADVSRDYALLPNERVVEVADAVANELGAVPFSDFSGTWYNRMKNNVISCGYKIHALYAWDKPVEITKLKDNGGFKSDTVQLGFAVHNSIDGSMGFSVGIFTFRHACSNMVWMGFKNTDNLQAESFDDRKNLSTLYRAHKGHIEIERGQLKETINGVIKKGYRVIEKYQDWSVESLTPELASKLNQSTLPRRVLPEFLQVEPEQIQFPTIAPPIWTVYNDITAKIWHSESVDSTKQTQFNTLHKVLIPAV